MAVMEVGEPCPVCGDREFEQLTAVRDNRTEAFEKFFPVARCASCRLTALRPLPSEDELSVGYERGYGPYPSRFAPASARPSELGNGAVADRLRQLWHLLDGAATVDRAPIAGRVLDVGSGKGEDVEYFLRHGHPTIGLEPNARAVEVCASKGLPVMHGTLESADLEPESFDTVVFNQVIEHVRHPEESLRIAFRVLRSRGHLIVFTPNIDGIPAKLFGNEWAHWHAPYHLYLYGPQQLHRLLTGAGFAVTRTSTVTPSFWINMSLQLWRHKSQQSGWQLPQRSWQPRRGIRLAVSPVFRTIDLFGKGDCLIVVAAKP